MGQNAEGAWRVAKARGDLAGGGAVDEVGAEGFILALGGGAGSRKKRTSLVSVSGESSVKRMMIPMFNDVNAKLATMRQDRARSQYIQSMQEMR